MRINNVLRAGLALVLASFLGLQVFAASSSSKTSIAAPNVSPECSKVHDELGQLFYIGVYGYKGHNAAGLAIQQEYVDLVRELNIGAVLPHVDSDDPQAVARSSHALQAAAQAGTSHLPAILGVDYDSLKTQNHKANFGLGYGSGLIGKFGGSLSNQCFSDLIFLDAYLHKAMGLNQSLGPTIERNPHGGFLSQDASKVMPLGNSVFDTFHQMGLGVTAKHFPYTPSDYNLHNRSEDTHVSESDVTKLLESFRESAPTADFVMSTHLMNSKIDPKDMVTFSDKWIKILRDQVGFQGLLVTDGLFMIDRYSGSVVSMASNWNGPQFNNTKSIFAARALLAGHDMVFLEGDAASTREVFHDLQGLACGTSEVGLKLRSRIFESFKRVEAYKKKHLKSLTQNVAPDAHLIDSAIGLYNKVSNGASCGSPEMKNFRDQIARLGIQPSEAKRELAKTPCEPASSQIEPDIMGVQKAINQVDALPDAERKAFVLRHFAAPVDRDKLSEVCDLQENNRRSVYLTLENVDPALFTFPGGLEAIGCANTVDARVRGKIIEALSNPDVRMRSMAAETFDQLGSTTPEEQDALLKLLNDSDMATRFNAVNALGKGRPRMEKTRHALIDLLKSRSELVKRTASDALFGNQDPEGTNEVVDALVAAFPSLNPEIKENVLWQMSYQYADNPKLYKFLLGILDKQNSQISELSLQATAVTTVSRMVEKQSREDQAKGTERIYAFMQAHKKEPLYLGSFAEAMGNLKSDDPRIQKLGVDLMASDPNISLVYSFSSKALQSATVTALRGLMKQGKTAETRAYSALSLAGSISSDQALKAEVQAKIVETLKLESADNDLKRNVVLTMQSNFSSPELQRAIADLLADPKARSFAISYLSIQTNKDPEAFATASRLAPEHFKTQ